MVPRSQVDGAKEDHLPYGTDKLWEDSERDTKVDGCKEWSVLRSTTIASVGDCRDTAGTRQGLQFNDWTRARAILQCNSLLLHDRNGRLQLEVRRGGHR